MRVESSELRIALYSHDACGLGHMRRNLAVAEVLGGEQRRAVLMLAGAREAGLFAMPPGTDCLALPALGKDRTGGYGPRSLAVPRRDMLALRSEALASALASFRPDVLIVDKLPLGVGDELRTALSQLAARGKTRIVLGMRDVLDEPSVVCREWTERGYEVALGEHYDAVWVYGDPRVYNPIAEYGMSSEVAAKARFSGYLGRRSVASPEIREIFEDFELPAGRLALCMVGGGEDGQAVARAFAGAALPAETSAVLVAGPLMPREVRKDLRRRAEGNPRLRVLDFAEDPSRLIQAADMVVSMGGYNTVCDLLSGHKRALIVPRVWPRQEQLIRAEQLRSLGLVDVLHPSDLSSPAIASWLAQTPSGYPDPRRVVDLDGLSRLPSMLDELLEAIPRVRTRGPEPIQGAGVPHLSPGRGAHSLSAQAPRHLRSATAREFVPTLRPTGGQVSELFS